METGEHIPEDLLELYSLGRLAEAEAAKVEEHLLVCEVCREELQTADEFIAALRSALKENPSLGGGVGDENGPRSRDVRFAGRGCR